MDKKYTCSYNRFCFGYTCLILLGFFLFRGLINVTDHYDKVFSQYKYFIYCKTYSFNEDGIPESDKNNHNHHIL